MPKKIDWNQIELDYIRGSSTYRELATRYAVGVSSIEGRASSGEWSSKRQAYRLAKQSSGDTFITKTEVASIRPASPIKLTGNEIDIKEILDTAISRYNEALSTLEPRSLERSTDALCRLLELRAKLYPQTLSELVERILEFGHDPKALAAELRRQLGNP